MTIAYVFFNMIYCKSIALNWSLWACSAATSRVEELFGACGGWGVGCVEGGPGTGPGLYLCVLTALAPGAAVAAAGTTVSPACSRIRLERG